MEIKISDLSVDELKRIIASTVQEAMEDYLEDLEALSSKDYLSSIREAREDYKSGEFKNLDEIS
jgi:predicted DNA-binding protein